MLLFLGTTCWSSDLHGYKRLCRCVYMKSMRLTVSFFPRNQRSSTTLKVLLDPSTYIFMNRKQHFEIEHLSHFSDSIFFLFILNDWYSFFFLRLLSRMRDYYFPKATSFPRSGAFHLALLSQSELSTKWTQCFEHQRFAAIFFDIHHVWLCLKIAPCTFIIVKHQSRHSPRGRLSPV